MGTGFKSSDLDGGRLICICLEGVDEIVDAQYGTAFNVFTGMPDRFCSSPPVIGGIVGAIMGGPQALGVFDCRTSFLGAEVEVLVDTNMKRAYEANYWKGVLDAQGKDDGSYY